MPPADLKSPGSQVKSENGSALKQRDFATGLRSGIFDARHFEAIGIALWTFAWCVDKQFDAKGWVLGGRVLTYRQIAAGVGLAGPKQAESQVSRLVKGGYLVRETTPIGVRLRISAPKKALRPKSPRDKEGVFRISAPDKALRGNPPYHEETPPRGEESPLKPPIRNLDSGKDLNAAARASSKNKNQGPAQDMGEQTQRQEQTKEDPIHPKQSMGPGEPREHPTKGTPSPYAPPTSQGSSLMAVEDLYEMAGEFGFRLERLNGALLANGHLLVDVLRLEKAELRRCFGQIARRNPKFQPKTAEGWIRNLLGESANPVEEPTVSEFCERLMKAVEREVDSVGVSVTARSWLEEWKADKASLSKLELLGGKTFPQDVREWARCVAGKLEQIRVTPNVALAELVRVVEVNERKRAQGG